MNECGYVTNTEILRAMEYGCPQIRERQFIFGQLIGTTKVEQIKKDTFVMPKSASQLPVFLRALKVEPMTL